MGIRRLKSKKQTSELRSFRFRSEFFLRFSSIFFVFGLTPIFLYLSGCNNEAQKAQSPAIVETTDRLGFLIASLENGDWSVRESAAKQLGEVNDARRVVEHLIVVLKDNHHLVRSSTAEALDKLGWKAEDEQEKVSYLIAKKKWDECVKIGNPAIESLIAVLKDNHPLVRSSAAEALDKLGWKAEDEQEKVSYLIAKKKWDECVKIGNPAVESLIAALKYEYADVRSSAAEALARIGIEHLIVALKDDEAKVRSSAALALGDIMIRDARAVEPLIVALKDNDAKVRSSAAEALGEIGDNRAVEPLINALKDNDAKVRSNSAYALGRIRDTRAVEPLIDGLKYQSVRIGAAYALGIIGDTRATGPLTALFKDYLEYDVRQSALRAIGNIGDQRAIPALVPCLKDFDFGGQVANVLQKLGWNPQSIDDKVHYAVATRDESTLVEMWEQTKSILLKDILSGEESTIENALYAFIRIGREEVIPNLKDTLNSKGNKTMAEAYLNCGHKDLASAAREWAAKHGYTIMYGAGAAPVRWGSR